jgi:DNA-binding transcriptional MocR family regulator
METYRYLTVEKNVMAMIDAGALRLGDKLPSLRGLSAKLGVSVSTVNQAYLELERKGVIEARARSGFFVRCRSKRLPRTESAPTPMEQPRPVTRIGLIQSVLESVGAANRVALDVIAPGPQRMPLRELGRITASMIRAEPERAMGYTPIPGDPELIRQIAYRSMEFGIPVEPDDPLITGGCLEALYIALRSVCRSGDTVLIQSPTYYCFLQLLETLGLRAIEVPSDPECGVSPGALAHALKTFDIAACVLAPNFNNPDSSLTPDGAKREIVEMLAQRDIPLVEDDVYTDLHFGPKRPGTFKQFDKKGLVLLCSSFSKTIAPGYRVGWMLPGRYRQKALEIKATTNVSSASPARWPSPNTCARAAWSATSRNCARTWSGRWTPCSSTWAATSRQGPGSPTRWAGPCSGWSCPRPWTRWSSSSRPGPRGWASRPEPSSPPRTSSPTTSG